MVAPISKDWWLAAAMASAALPAAVAQTQPVPPPAPAQTGGQIGVATSVGLGRVPASSSKPIYIDGTRGQKLSTGPNETLHLLFSDQSAITVGPNSELVIAEYRFDTEKKDGQLAVELAKGFLRVVGGLLSKKRETMIKTATATIGIRGGISTVDSSNTGTQSYFFFGQSMTVSNPNGGGFQTVSRPGFGIGSSQSGIGPPTVFPPFPGFGSFGPPPGFSNLINGLAPDRISTNLNGTPNIGNSTGGLGGQLPTLAGVLGTPSPGNQS